MIYSSYSVVFYSVKRGGAEDGAVGEGEGTDHVAPPRDSPRNRSERRAEAAKRRRLDKRRRR